MTLAIPLRGQRIFAVLFLFGLLSLLPLFAQQPATGSIEGRVYNPTNREYVGNAEVRLLSTGDVSYTESDGSFRFASVATGDVSVSVSYSGYETLTVSFNVVAGQVSSKEVSIIPIGGSRKTSDDGTVMLEAFTVSSEREGNAKAIMAQRRNMDITTSVSSDVFGDVTDGNVGEFLKYLPGVDVDYVESEARGPRLGGMDAQYVGVTFDGMRMASADALRTGTLGRATSFEGFSITAIESVVISRTTSAESDADSPAGTINMKPRKAFDRKGRHMGFNASVNFNSEEFTWRQTVGPDDRWHYKWKPNLSLNYSDVFEFGGKKLGILLSGSRANSYTEQYSCVYDYNNAPTAADPRKLVIRQLDIKDGPKFITKDSFLLTADMKVSPRLVLSLNMMYAYALGEFHNRNFTFVAANNNANVNNGRSTVGGDGVTTVIANRTTTNTVPTVNNGGTSEAKNTWTRTFTPKFEYRLNDWLFDGAISKSKSVNDYDAIEAGFINGEGQSVASSWIATRPSADSQNWTIRQTSGADWFDPLSWTSTTQRDGGTRATDSGRLNITEIWTAQLNAQWVTPVKKFPTTIKFGGKWNEEVRKNNNATEWNVWSYVGPNGNELTGYNATTGLPTLNLVGRWANVGPQYVSPQPFEMGTTNALNLYNISGVNGLMPRANRVAIATLFQEHPEYFIHTGTVDNFYNAFIANRRDVKETIEAGFAQADIKFGPKLTVRAGLRFEETTGEFKEYDPLTKNELTAAGYASNASGRATSLAGVYYQYMSRPQITREISYLDWFPSIVGKYNIRKNVEFQMGYNKSIGRPPIDYLTGAWNIIENSNRIDAPNAKLEPEYHTNYQARLAWYFEPSGQLSVAVTQNDIENTTESYDGNVADFGIDDPEYASYTIRSRRNIPGTTTIRNLEIGYNQTLVFLPSAFRGTTVGLTYNRSYSSRRREGLAPHRVSGRLGYSYRRFNGNIGIVWRDDAPWSNAGRYQRQYTMVDTQLNWKLSNNVWLFVQGRNILKEAMRWFESPQDVAEGKEGVLRQYQYYGSNWVFGIRGDF